MNIQNEAKMSVLQLEYTQQYNRLLYLDGQANGYVNIILTAIAALAAFLSFLVAGDHITDMFFFSILVITGTIVIGLLILMTLHHTIQCYRVGGYMKYLEELINDLLEEDILKWENHVTVKYIHKDITSQSVFLIVGILFFVLLFISAYFAINFIFPRLPVLASVIFFVIALEIVSALIYLHKSGTIHEKTYNIAKSSHK